jgi:uncharacterized protein YjbI with pentapeptide repeats
MTTLRWVAIAGLALCAAGCGEPEGSSVAGSPSSPAPWVMEAELLANPNLRVTPSQVVVLDLARTGVGQARVRHEIPYRFEDTTTYHFCIPQGEQYIDSAELFEEGAAVPLVRVVPGADCVTRTIEPGLYRLVVEHDGRGISNTGKRAFIHVPRLKEEPPVLAGTAPQESTSPGGLASCDALAVLTTADGLYLNASPEAPLYVTLKVGSLNLAGDGWLVCPDANGAYEIYDASDYGNKPMYPASDGHILLGSVGDPAPPFDLVDLGDFQFLFSTAAFTNGQATPADPIVVGSDLTLQWTASGSSLVYGIPIKYYLPGVEPPPPQMGEVELQHSCDTSHGTWVVRANLPKCEGVESCVHYDNGSIIEILNRTTTGVLVRPGPQTVASFYELPGYHGLKGNFGEDTCVSDHRLDQFRSMKVTAARDFIIANDYCRNCNLTGIDLSGLDLTHGYFAGSTFTGANLTGTNLTLANLRDANLSGPDVQLTGAIFTDAVLENTNFRGADLSGATATSTEGVRANFSTRPDLTGATIDVGTFLSSDWKYLNLTGAAIYNVQGATLSTTDSPVDFSGAILNSVDLDRALLDGGRFDCDSSEGHPVCTQLSNTNLNLTSLKKASFVDANLQGANLDFANLDSANLCSAKLNLSADLQKSASLQGAYLRNVNLYQADLTGANLTNSDFYSTNTSGICNGASCGPTTCATAGDATLNSTTFSQAYLGGTDFSDASCKGVDFGRAFLLGANFTNVNLSVDNNTGRTTNFRQADLRGANLSTAASVTDANFDGALIDTKSASATVKLESGNTMFAGFTPNPPSAAGCVQFTYPHASATPRTDNSNTCPNGSTGACSATAQWVLPTPTPGCSAIDFNWGIAPQ